MGRVVLTGPAASRFFIVPSQHVPRQRVDTWGSQKLRQLSCFLFRKKLLPGKTGGSFATG